MPGLGGDMDVFHAWATTLTDKPLDQFYSGTATVQRDHLPGDLLLLAGVAHVHDALGLGARGFDIMIKLVAVLADLLVALLLHLIVRDRAGSSAADRTLKWYLFCPAPFVISAAWGQWDAVSTAMVLAALHLVLRGGRTWVLAAPLVTWAVLVKPQMAIVAILLTLLVAVRQRRALREQAATVQSLAAGWALVVASSVAVALALTQLFGLGLWWTPSGGLSLWSVLQDGLDLFPYTTNGAANLWMLVEGQPQRTPDDDALLGPLTASGIGSVLFVALLVLATFGARKLLRVGRPPRRLQDGTAEVDVVAAWCWVAALSMTGAFALLTRVHERYLFPGLVLVVLLTGLLPRDRWTAACFWVSGIALTSNLFLAILANQPDADPDPLALPFVITAAAQVAVLVALAAWPWTPSFAREGRRQRLVG